MKAKVILLSIVALLVACTAVDKGTSEAQKYNDQAYRLRYTDISASLQAAKKAYTCSEGNRSSRAEALNNMAYVAYQQMRYDQALHLLKKVYSLSRNQLELLCADVLAMKVTQRIGQGKPFFDARLRAEKRISRIQSEQDNLTARQQHRFHYALTEYHIVASTYYYYLGQDNAARREINEASRYVNLDTDTTQWLYYQYMLGSGGLVEGIPEAVATTEFNHLFRVYTLAKANRYIYFEANALQSLSAMIADSTRAEWVKQGCADAYTYLYAKHVPQQMDETPPPRLQLASSLAQQSITLFQQYCDLFQTAGACRTLGEVYFSFGHYDEALQSFRRALHLASDHSRSPYLVKPWLAGIHENLSLTYSALGNKQFADSHRNTYLDLLDDSRQNRELDSRKALLKQEARTEQLWVAAFLLRIFVVVLLAYFYYRQLGQRSLSFERQVRHIASSEEAQMAHSKLESLLKEGEERLELCQEECELAQQRLQLQQQRHILQRTKLSVVYAIMPYLDRVISEVKRLDEQDTNVGERLTYIQELCSGMMNINDRLTSWIQMQQGRLNLQVKRFCLNDVLQVISMQQYVFAQQELELEVPTTDIVIKADKALTLFMVNTLVDNARKFTPAGGKVSICLESFETYVEISIEDTGIGLSQEDVQTLNDSKIYDPSSIGTSGVGKGFGFGIMNCKGIIGNYRKLSSLFSVCDFGVESSAKTGSRFWFRLPRVMTMLFFVLSSLLSHAMPQRCYELYDSTYSANLQRRHADAMVFADSALQLAELPIDTLLLVSLYNEQAIAAQALCDWDTYNQSNSECVRLHHLYSIDASLVSDCQRLEKMNSDSRVLYVLIVLLFLASLALFYKVVLRHRLRHRASLDDLYQKLICAISSFPNDADSLKELVGKIKQPHLRKAVEDLCQVLTKELSAVKAVESLSVETEDKLQRLRFEHDRLYVMNQVLDNSLSTIKHETMYFPSRIKLLSDNMQQHGFDVESQANLLELVTYYRHIYMLLYEQAQHQTDQSALRIQNVPVAEFFSELSQRGIECKGEADVCVKGDRTLLHLLFDQFCTIDTSCVRFEAERRAEMVYMSCSVEGERLSQEQLSDLFSPRSGRLECLVMKQIIHEHDAACGHPGLRLVAEDMPKGYKITFSLKASDAPLNHTTL